MHSNSNVSKRNMLFNLGTHTLFVVCLIALAFCKVNKGLDFTDSTYSISNFIFVDKLDGMWYYSTFYANLLGKVLVSLPGGRSLLGLNIYTGFVKLILALLSYIFYSRHVGAKKWIAFLGSALALSLCWCPTTILYNYLTYLLFFLGAILLYIGLCSEGSKRQITYLMLAGFCLGSNVLVRLPNVAESALILALWLDSFVKKERFKEAVNKTLFCILGYVIALLVGAVFIASTRGIPAYFEGLNELFAMTSEASGYSTAGMILAIITAYLVTFYWAVPILIAFVVASVAMLLFDRYQVNKYVKLLIYILIGIVCILVLYKKGMFYHNFHTFDPVYRLSAVILIFAIIFDIVVLIGKEWSANNKLLASISLIVIGITPLGSNNEIYSNLNNLFLVLPTLYYFTYLSFLTKKKTEGIKAIVCVLCCLLEFNGIMFGVNYVFRDGANEVLNTKVYNNSTMTGMITSEVNAKRLSEVTDVWLENDFSNGEVLLYGNVSGMCFYLDTPSAISTAWPSLDSFSKNKFEKEIENLQNRIDEGSSKLPAVIIGEEEYNGVIEGNTPKQEILKNFLEKNNYICIYNNDMFYVLKAE